MTVGVHRKGRIADYVLPVVGLAPMLLGIPQPAQPAGRVDQKTSLYRQDLVERADLHLLDIRELLSSLVVPTPLAELVYAEDDPDHRPYSDAYTWEPVEISLAVATVSRELPDDAPEVWF